MNFLIETTKRRLDYQESMGNDISIGKNHLFDIFQELSNDI